MCKTTMKRGEGPRRLGAVLLGVAAVTLGAYATQNPPGCTSSCTQYTPQKQFNTVTNGTTMFFKAKQFMNGGDITCCDVLLGPTGFNFTCPGPTGDANGPTVNLIPGNTLLPGGLAGFGPIDFSNNCTIVLNAGVVTAHALYSAPGALLLDSTTSAGDPVDISKGLSVNIVTPCIKITKQCVNTCTPIHQPIAFSGTVTNCGDIRLDNVGVVDEVNGQITVILGPTNTLAKAGDPGSSLTYSGSYTPPGDGCGPFKDTATATGTAHPDSGAVTVTSSDSATCHVQVNPAITLVKTCAPQCLSAGDSYTETFAVTNTGDVTLTNVVVTDTNRGVVTTYTSAQFPCLASIAPSQGCVITTGPIATSKTDCGNITDTASASGTSACPFDSVCPANINPRSAQAQCTVEVVCCPAICVTKEVACATCVNLDFRKTATGASSGNQFPAFRYRIIVSNCGDQDLKNVTVTDTLIPAVAGTFPSTLPVGGPPVTNYFTQTYTKSPSTNVNTVTATGTATSAIDSCLRSKCPNVSAQGTVSATSSATAIVQPASVTCQNPLLHSALDQDGSSGLVSNTVPVSTDNCHVTLPQNSGIVPVSFSTTVTNDGKVDLNVTVTPGAGNTFVDCGDLTTPVPLTFTLAAGQSTVFTGCVLVDTAAGVCPTPANIGVQVQGTARTNSTIECICDSNGQVITTAKSTACACGVDCIAPVVIACRVTGGGDLIPGFTETNCQTVTTTIIPLSQCNQTIEKITHGGQLGAPFDQMSCGSPVGNPCIRGNWSHHRHYAGGNAVDQFDIDFHSQTPSVRGVYDSLDCACLGCCGADGSFIPASTNIIHKKVICNPDDHKICGPQPAPSPANAIIFSGIGTFASGTECGAKNVKATYMVFRVYIEDRSEPGGGKKLSTAPADIYCFQSWDTGVVVSRNNDNTLASGGDLTSKTLGSVNAFRTAVGQANCDFISSLGPQSTMGSLPSPTVSGQTANIQDCGPLYVGNHQLHESTGAADKCP